MSAGKPVVAPTSGDSVEAHAAISAATPANPGPRHAGVRREMHVKDAFIAQSLRPFGGLRQRAA